MSLHVDEVFFKIRALHYKGGFVLHEVTSGSHLRYSVGSVLTGVRHRGNMLYTRPAPEKFKTYKSTTC